MALAGLIASFQGIMFAAGRSVYSLSRTGCYPKFLSLTGVRKTPWVALLATAVIGLVLVFGLGAIAYGADEQLYVSAANALLLIAGIIALVTLILMPFNEDYRAVVVWVAVVYVVSLGLFAIFGRKRLVLSPEEEYAITRGVHGHPETEGYDVTEQREEFPKNEPQS